MLFNTFQFAIFFGVLLLVYWNVPRTARNAVLLGASLVFYSLWIPAYLLLLLFDVGVNYALMRAIARSARPKRYLAASIAFTLGMLAYFKYAAMVISTLLPALSWSLGWSPTVPELFLPLGISFYSFQIIALNVDVYRRTNPPVENFARYLLFVSFFPQLIAGPILRGYELLGQLERGGVATSERSRRGLWLITSGLCKKVVFADFLLAPFVDRVYALPDIASGPYLLIATYSFAFQIYFDFSGYTDMARGLACLLGFEIPLNFMEPYLSRNPSEFWRRWHITLSRWLQDYLYIPLGGNRRSAGRTYVNLFLTMLLGGLWHGAAWLFVVWGGVHGLMLAVHRRFASGRIHIDAPLRISDVPRILVLFNLTSLVWIFFRAASLEDAETIVMGLFTGNYLGGWPVMQTGVVLLCMQLHAFERFVRLRLPEIQGRIAGAWWGTAAEGLLIGTIVATAVTFSGTGGEFIYFQF